MSTIRRLVSLRGIWSSSDEKQGNPADLNVQMPHTDYDEWARSSPERFPGSKRGATARSVRILACWQSCCSRLVGSFAADQVRRLFIGFKTDRSGAVHARLFSRRLAIRAAN